MDEKIIEIVDRLFAFGYKALDLIDKFIDRKYPEPKDQPNAEGVWKVGEPLPEPQSTQEYRDFPSNQPGRFERAIAAARRAHSDEDNPNS